MEIFSIILGHLFGIGLSIGSNLATDGLKAFYQNYPQRFPLLDRFYKAFLDSFILYKEKVEGTQRSSAKIPRKYIGYSDQILEAIKYFISSANQGILVAQFKETPEDNLEDFLRKIKSNEGGIRETTAEHLIKKFNLLSTGIPKEDIIKVLSGILSCYYDSFLSQMTVQEGLQQIITTIFSNRELLSKIQIEVQEVRNLIQEENKIQNQQDSGFYILDARFWEQTKQNAKTHMFPDYYLKIDSKPRLLMEVIACDYHVPNIILRQEFKRVLSEVIESQNTYSLIKILSKAGEGKSTFLLDIAKIHERYHNIIYFDGLQNDQIENIRNAVSRVSNHFDEKVPILVLLDNPESIHNLLSLQRSLFKVLYGFRIVFIIAERQFRYDKMEDKDLFENGFHLQKTLKYSSISITKYVGNKLLEHVKSLPTKGGNLDVPKFIKQFTIDDRDSISDRIYYSIVYLIKQGGIRYTFDWDDWRNFVTRKTKHSRWEHLYTFIAIFYQFGHRPTRAFCAQFLEIDDFDLMAELNNDHNLPIYTAGAYLLLRHENMAKWYFEYNNLIGKSNHKQMGRYLLGQFLGNIKTPFAKDLFIWFSKSPELKESFLFEGIKSRVPQEFRKLDKDKILNKLKIILLSKYLKIDENDIKSHTELGKAYLREASYNKAEEVLLKVIALDMNAIHARTELGKVYQEMQELRKAKDVLLEAIELDKSNRYTLHSRTELGKVYQGMKDLRNAEKILLEALSIKKDHIQSRTELGKVYQELKEWGEAEKVLLEIIGIESKNIHARTELGKVYQKLKRWRAAEKVLKEILLINQKHIQSRTELGKVYQELKELEKAKEILLEAIELDKSNRYTVHTRTELGKVYQELKELEKAKEILLEAIELDKSNRYTVHTRTELGKVYQEMKELGKAKEVLLKAIELDKHNRYTVHTRTELGKVYQKLKEWEKAKEILLEAIELDKHNRYTVHTRTELGKVYQKLKEWEKAKEILLEAIELDKSNRYTIHARTELGKVYQKLEQWNEAERILLKVIELDTNNIQARTVLAMLYSRLNEDRDCERVLDKVIEIEPNNVHALYLLAQLYTKQRKYREKEKKLFEIYHLNPDNVYALLGLFEIFRRFRKYHIARDLLNRARELEPKNLCIVKDLLYLNRTFRDYETIDKLLKKGEGILKSNPYAKCLKNYKNFSFEKSAIQLIERRLKGKYVNGQIESESGEKIRLVDNVIMNNRLRNNDKVWYSTFGDMSKGGLIFANFIEPYYDNLDDLENLK